MAGSDPVVDQLFRAILTARVYEVCDETPLEVASQLSARLGNTVHLEREDLHPVFSFKIRGAFNRMATLSEAERQAGVIAASAGNHAQGVAFAARHLGVAAVIVMPVTTPTIKVDSVRGLGGRRGPGRRFVLRCRGRVPPAGQHELRPVAVRRRAGRTR